MQVFSNSKREHSQNRACKVHLLCLLMVWRQRFRLPIVWCVSHNVIEATLYQIFHLVVAGNEPLVKLLGDLHCATGRKAIAKIAMVSGNHKQCPYYLCLVILRISEAGERLTQQFPSWKQVIAEPLQTPSRVRTHLAVSGSFSLA